MVELILLCSNLAIAITIALYELHLVHNYLTKQLIVNFFLSTKIMKIYNSNDRKNQS